MQLEEFYSALLPSEGSFALFEKATKRHVWFDSIPELVAGTAKHALTSPDWYFATAAFTGQTRTQAGVSGKKCFYLDLDAGPEKLAKHGEAMVYPTLQDAAKAVKEFAQETGLTPTLVVFSGGGLHVYWALNEVVSEWEWTADATRLKKITKEFGLKADHSCTSDSARILRPIGGLHSNGEVVRLVRNPRKIWDVADFRAKLTALCGNDIGLSAPPAYLRDVSDDVTQHNSVPINFGLVVHQCPAMAYATEERGKYASEPLWRAMISIVKCGEKGDKITHAMSRGHPGYDFAATQEKYERYTAGPMTCDTIGGLTDKCEGCKHRGKITSPVTLGRQHDAPAPTPAADAPAAELPVKAVENKLMPLGVLPAGFMIQYEGDVPTLKREVRVNVKDADGKATKVWEDTFAHVSQDIFWFDGWMDNDGDQGTEYTLFIKRGGLPAQTHTLAGGSLSSISEALKTLADKGIRPDWRSEEAVKHMSKYVEAQIARIKKAASRPVVRNHYGFRFENVDGEQRMTCAHGPYMIHPDGSIRRALVSSALHAAGAQFGIAKLPDNPDQTWEPTVWETHIYDSAKIQAAFYKKHHVEGHELLQLVIALHMASPFLLFAAENDWSGGPLPANGFTVSLYSSRSGVGKSATMKAAAAAWGNPNSLVPAGSKHDMTQNAMVARIASHGTMAFAADEVTQNGPLETANLINVVAGGQTKYRATKTGGVSGNQSTWSLISVLSSNTRQREMLALAQSQSSALQMRMIELDCDTLTRVDAATSQSYEEAKNSELYANYGALGAMINYACVKAGYAEMRKRGMAALAKAREVLPNSQEGRFFCRALAAVFMLQDVLEQIGLPIFDTASLSHQFKVSYISSINSARQLTMTSVDRVREYVRSNIRSFATTDNFRTSGPQKDRLLGGVPLEVMGRNVLATGLTYIAIRPFSKWCADSGASALTVLNELQGQGRLLMTQSGGSDTAVHSVNLTHGLDLPAVVQDCIVINAGLEAFSKMPANVTQLKLERVNADPDSERSGQATA